MTKTRDRFQEMRAVGERLGATLLAALLAIAAQPAFAQSAGDFRLPPSTSTPAPRVQGPVDPDNPVIAGPRPAPRPTPTPAPVQSATPQPTGAPVSSQPGTAATSRPGATRVPPAPRPGQQGAPPQTTGTAPLAPAPGASSAPASNAPIFSTVPQQGPAPTLVPTQSSSPDWLPIAGGVLALLLAAAGAFVWWRRRKDEAPVEIEFERPVVTAPQPEAPPPAATAIPEPQLSSVPDPVVSQEVEQDGLALSLEARRMSASLMATTLSYRITLTNRSKAPLAALAIEGDMIAAHGSLPPEQQVAGRDQKLELRHALVELAPGESAEFIGDIRVPLNMITPIRAGEAAYFIPLARFRVEAGDLVLAQTFVVGEQPTDPAASLRPFRLDLGPRTYSKLGQRAL